eukprot:scaffold3772_cov120-Isochrysis_galbana.AAC.1
MVIEWGCGRGRGREWPATPLDGGEKLRKARIARSMHTSSTMTCVAPSRAGLPCIALSRMPTVQKRRSVSSETASSNRTCKLRTWRVVSLLR